MVVYRLPRQVLYYCFGVRLGWYLSVSPFSLTGPSSPSALPPVHSHKLRPYFATSLIDSELAQCAEVTKAAQNIDACSMRSPVVVVVVVLLNGDCGVFKLWALLHFVFSA